MPLTFRFMPRSAVHTLSVAAVALVLTGCASPQSTSESGGETVASSPAAGADGAVSTPSGDVAAARRAATVEREYIIGPEAARSFGMRIDWQMSAVTSGTRHVLVQGDSIFILDERNMLMRIDRTDGRPQWRVPVSREMADSYGVNYVPESDRVLVLTGPELLILDAVTGSQLSSQPLVHFANTPGTLYGPYILYGSRNGLLIWHQYELGAFLRGYSVSTSMRVPPVVGEGFILATGVDGRIMSITAGSASMVWSQRALGAISAKPAISSGMAFVAAEDQYLRAFEIDRARSPRWSRLMPSALTDSPVVIGDFVYQRVPGVGLVCFEAFPPSAPGGVLVWTADDSTGQVIRRSGNDLLTWDANRRRIEVVDASLGGLARSVAVPQARHVISEQIEGSDLIIISDQGDVLRLVPRQ